jgi:CRP/FNR family transcriptional regulator
MAAKMNWLSHFEELAQLGPDVRDTLLETGVVMTVPANTVIFAPGKPPENLLLLLSGRVKVQQVSESGREIVLYRVEAGQSCIMTTAAMIAAEEYSAEGIAETEVRAVAIPRVAFDELVSQSPGFRNFILKAYSKRITDLFQIIEDIAFQRVDIRLAQSLIALSRGGGQILATHQQMAAELGTAREVVSRQLGEFQRRGWIRQSRGVIEILDRDGIAHLASLSTD